MRIQTTPRRYTIEAGEIEAKMILWALARTSLHDRTQAKFTPDVFDPMYDAIINAVGIER